MSRQADRQQVDTQIQRYMQARKWMDGQTGGEADM